jgi:uncharacterized membrane protein (DUF4010 family)
MFGTLAAMLSEKANMPWLLFGGLLIVGLMTIAAYSRVQKTTALIPGTTTDRGYSGVLWTGRMPSGTETIRWPSCWPSLPRYCCISRAELHGITEKLTRRDLISMLQFAVLTFIILPILPDKNYGPYEAINPYQIWLMVVLISGVSLAGYVALHTDWSSVIAQYWVYLADWFPAPLRHSCMRTPQR